MKKLNNQGWGLGPFVILVCVILCAVIIVVSLVIRVFGGTFGVQWGEQTGANVNYIQLEKDLKSSAMSYQRKYYSDISTGDRFIVSLKRLKDEGMAKNNTDCTGYVEILKSESDINYNAYINCKNYTTKGYEARLDN